MNILVTRHDKIGDFMTMLPTCKVLKEHTNHKIVMLVSKVNVALAKKMDFIDDVIEYSDDTFTLLKRLSPYKFDVSISGYIDFNLGFALFLARIPVRIAPATKIAQIFFNKKITQRRSRVEKTEWAYNLDLVKQFDENIDLNFSTPLVDLNQTRENFVIFHAGFGGSSDGNLKLDEYLSLAKKASSVCKVVFSFGPDDKETQEYIEQNIDFEASIRDDFSSLWDFTTFIAKAKLFVSTSTGPMHLAGLTNTPTLSFFGNNLFASSKRWATISDASCQHNYEIPSNYGKEFYDIIENKLMEIIIMSKYTDIDFNNKTILITGAAGFIGSNLAFYFQENYPQATVVAFDMFRSGETFSNGNLKSFGHFKNLLGFNGIVVSGDINDKGALKALEHDYKFDYIFHQAAISDTTVQEQDLMIKTNVNAYEDLLKIAINHGANMIYASSAATYGDSDRFEIGYEQPNNAYGFSKVMMDNITYKYIKEGVDISIVGLKYFNVYGPREFFKNSTASMVVQFGHQILKGLTPKLFEGSDKILRDFIFIEDIIQANIKACSPKKSGVYNVGTGKARSFEDIVTILQKELAIDNGKEYIPNPFVGSYQFFTQANIESTKENLGYEPKYEMEDGIKAYIPEIKRLFDTEVKK